MERDGMHPKKDAAKTASFKLPDLGGMEWQKIVG
jgi:hypothetical protein